MLSIARHNRCRRKLRKLLGEITTMHKKHEGRMDAISVLSKLIGENPPNHEKQVGIRKDDC